MDVIDRPTLERVFGAALDKLNARHEVRLQPGDTLATDVVLEDIDAAVTITVATREDYEMRRERGHPAPGHGFQLPDGREVFGHIVLEQLRAGTLRLEKRA